MTDPKVTVSLITYNHAPFIAQAIESVLAQVTDFPFELVIGEDDSSDGTREIVQRYAASHPEKIRVHWHSRSSNIAYDGRPTGRYNLVHNLKSARGKYIALLDGDDYWTDPHKLQLQADYLDAHPESSTCFCPARTVNEKGEPVATAPPLNVLRPIYTLTHLLAGEFRPRLSTVMYRRGLFNEFPDWYYTLPAGDYPLHVLNGQHGDFGLINREMVSYRIHPGGIWTQGFSEEDFWKTAPATLQIRRLRTILELQSMALRVLDAKYHAVLRPLWFAHMLRLANVYWSTRSWREMRQTLRCALRGKPPRANYSVRCFLQALLVSHFPFLSRQRAAPKAAGETCSERVPHFALHRREGRTLSSSVLTGDPPGISIPKVTVSIITYNHASYIAQAIESVLAQVTTFPFELIIGEDDSSDGTREIVQRYAALYPDKIRVNLHARGSNITYEGEPTGRHNFVQNLRSARGRYIALLDGDDYFTDPEKLQRQAELLDAHPECSTCFHRVDFVNEAGDAIPTTSQVEVVKEIYSLEELLRGKFFTRTASVMFRRGLFDEFPEWYFRSPVGDFPLHVLNGLRGDFCFLDRPMAKYRFHTGGRWSAGDAANDGELDKAAERRLRQLKGTIHLYEILEAELGEVLGNPVREGLAIYRYQLANLLHHDHETADLRNQAWTIIKSRPLPREIPILDVVLLLLEGCLPACRKVITGARGKLAEWRKS